MVGLFFNGIATYYGAEVSSDQLKQSKEDSDREARQQAGEITYWIEDEDAVYPTRNIHLVNRSPDAVSEVHLGLDVDLGGPDTDRGPFVLTSITLRPCAEFVFKPKDLWVYPEKHSLPVASLGGVPGWGPWYLEFTDRNGRAWIRSQDGLTEQSPDFPKKQGGILLPKPKYPPQIKKVDNCADGGE